MACAEKAPKTSSRPTYTRTHVTLEDCFPENIRVYRKYKGKRIQRILSTVVKKNGAA